MSNLNTSFFSTLYHDRRLLFKLSRNDFKARFSTSFLGVIWAYIQPLVTMLVFWFVFQVGLRNGDIGDFPFIVWYAPAFLVWTFYSDTVSSMTNSLREYSYLVKKVNFNIGLIPSVKLVSGVFVHAAFIVFIVLLNVIYAIEPSWYYLQVFYYFLCCVVLLFAQGMLFASILPFFGDMGNIVGVILQVGFWATPIVWSADSISVDWVRVIMSLNPMYYICNGYRDCFLYQIGFWEHPDETILFWCFALLLTWFSIRLFTRLRRDFVDVM